MIQNPSSDDEGMTMKILNMMAVKTMILASLAIADALVFLTVLVPQA